MSMLKTFSKGGVHPPENKLSSSQKIEILPLPKTVTIPISQHIGAPATIVVKKNEMVKVGQVVAKSSGFVSSNIHSSVSGKVSKIDTFMNSSGFKKQSIVIQVKDDEWDEAIDTSTDIKRDIDLTPEEIIEKIGNAGIVGLGGATFPSQVKLMVPKGMKAEVLILNGVECEPYLTADHRLMLEHGEEMLKVKYPQGGEKQLIKAVINREVPSGGLPIAVGAVVHNVGTAYAVYQAVQKNKPLIDRVVTVTGKSVKKPANYLVRVGTPVDSLIEASGGLPEDTGKVISGGPMMGKALNTTDVPVTKGTSGILILPKGESRRGKIRDCIRCAKCVSVCPMGLEPYLLMTTSQRAMHERTEKERVMDCIECGSCSYTCPSFRPLLDYIRLGKAEVGKIIRSRKS